MKDLKEKIRKKVKECGFDTLGFSSQNLINTCSQDDLYLGVFSPMYFSGFFRLYNPEAHFGLIFYPNMLRVTTS